QEVAAVCQRVLILRHGELVIDTALASLKQNRQLLVGTDADEQRLRALLAGIDGITAIRRSRDHDTLYALDLDAPADAIAPQVARLLVENGQQLFTLQTHGEDLETLFHDVNVAAAAEVAHA